MALHFSPDEFAARETKLLAEMAKAGLDGMLLFAQESTYWLTGYDTFGYCFFQCLAVKADGTKALLTRSADLRQAQHTSNIGDIRIWVDRGGSSPVEQLKDMLASMGLIGGTIRLGVEYDTHGLTAKNGRQVDAILGPAAMLVDASSIVPSLRVIKSAAEIAYVREAARLGDAALAAAEATIDAGVDEGLVLSRLQGAIFEGGGDFPANEVIIGSGPDALLCRYKAGRRVLSSEDQITLELAGTYRHYHAALMRTVCVGRATPRHIELHAAASEALSAVEAAMRSGNTFGDVFAAHAEVMDAHGLEKHRLNACGYSLGARFTPSWMDPQMFYADNPFVIVPNMVLFAHMILMDSDSGTAMCLGRTYLTTDGAPDSLSKASTDLLVK
jgi:Xaa-Pro dipeptidase